MLEIGDVVRHRVLGSEKIVVGIGGNRFLCAYSSDLLKDGHLRPQARIALHREEHLEKVGHVEAHSVNLSQLYEKELKTTRRLRRRNLFRREIAPAVLFAVAVAPLVFVLFAGIEAVQGGIENLFFHMVERAKSQLMAEEVDKIRQETSRKEASPKEERLKQKFLKAGVSEQEIEQLKGRYLKTEVSAEELEQLGRQYLATGLSKQEKDALKRKYLKTDLSGAEIKMLKEKYLKGGISREEKESFKRQYLKQ